MIIIHSGAYVSPELRAEFGPIPPCMLPLGNKKLIEQQVKALREAFPDQRIIVTLPDDYALTVYESLILEKLKVRTISLPARFSLCAALLHILGPLDEEREIRVLHGDILLSDFPLECDLACVAADPDAHPQALNGFAAGYTDSAWSGFFAFSSSLSLLTKLKLSEDSFTDAVARYGTERPLRFVSADRLFYFGHNRAYFCSRTLLTTQRSFNTLRVEANVITKTGTPSYKIEAEADWFCRIPPPIKKYIPQLISKGTNSDGQAYYQSEYLPLNPLNDLFVHGRNSVVFWLYVFDLIKAFLHDAAIPEMDESSVRQAATRLYADKTRQRVKLFTDAAGIDPTQALYYAERRLPSILEICEDCLEKTLALPYSPGILHGDLCWSNILIDLRSGIVKLVDPRGIDADNQKSVHGDQKYDLAKLTHSCIGLYDFIISGYYKLETADPYHYHIDFFLDERLLAVQKEFWKKRFLSNCSVADSIPLTVLLFLSMLPLHDDNPKRQRALLANALRLYQAHVL